MGQPTYILGFLLTSDAMYLVVGVGDAAQLARGGTGRRGQIQRPPIKVLILIIIIIIIIIIITVDVSTRLGIGRHAPWHRQVRV